MNIIIQERYGKTLYKKYKEFHSIEEFIKFFNKRILANEYSDNIKIYMPYFQMEAMWYDYTPFRYVIENDVDNEQLKRNIIICHISVADLPKDNVYFSDIEELQKAYAESLDSYISEVYSIKDIVDILNGHIKDSLDNTVSVLHILDNF